MEKEKSFQTFVIDDVKHKTLLSTKYLLRKPYQPVKENIVKAFLPGKILKIMVKDGDKVKIGTDLCILEAMKMENRIKAHISGKITKLNINKGDKVTKNTVLLEIEE